MHPWNDYPLDPVMEKFAADDLELLESLRRSAWLENEADLETVLDICAGTEVEVDHDTRLDHNVYVKTNLTEPPSTAGFGDWLTYFVDVRHAIDRYTDYRITNTRMVDGRFTLTLAPEE